MENNATPISSFQGIKRFVVLMLENRSFDHVFGYMRATNSKVAGLTGSEFNQKDPNPAGDPAINVNRASSFLMRFDPGHEFYDRPPSILGQWHPRGRVPDGFRGSRHPDFFLIGAGRARGSAVFP